MLLSISIKNFGIIDQLRMDFQNGFNVLTGETGAGKSIIIDALQIVLGGRVSAGQIRTGAEKAFLQAAFDISAVREIDQLLDEQGVDAPEDATLILAREISRSGKSVSRVNGQVVTLGFLKKVGGSLADMHMQLELNSLLDQEKQRQLLDRFGGDRLLQALQEVNSLYTRWKEARLSLDRLTADAGDRDRRKGELLYMTKEIELAKLRLGEDIELEEEKKVLANAEKINSLVSGAYALLYGEAGGQLPALDLLAQAVEALRNLAALDKRAETILAALENAYYQAEDAVRELACYRDGIEFSPNRLEAVEDRLEQIKRLKRKYGETISEIIDRLKAMRGELAILENTDELLQEAVQEIGKVEAAYSQAAGVLSTARREAAGLLREAVSAELLSLEMGRVAFQVAFTEISGPARDGLERVDFLIATNPGEPLKQLSKIASGGELTRVMLALKAILAVTDEIPVLVFDEADTGIGGRSLQSVAEKMSQLGRHRQVICVTHSAQVASHAKAHYLIVKEMEEGRTVTRARLLEPGERLEELARMLGGREITEITRRHARQMLENASGKRIF
ncbi:MAG: DNA repair protein RecN [Peptococcaceae bacterium]|nr:DNA repair protein RecN [Peptococcaceae bacterium]